MTSSDKQRIEQAAKDRANSNAIARHEDPANYLLFEEDWFKAGAEYEHNIAYGQGWETGDKDRTKTVITVYNQAIADITNLVHEHYFNVDGATLISEIQKLKK